METNQTSIDRKNEQINDVIILQWTIMDINELSTGIDEGDSPKYDTELRKGEYCLNSFFKFQIHAKLNNILCWDTERLTFNANLQRKK